MSLLTYGESVDDALNEILKQSGGSKLNILDEKRSERSKEPAKKLLQILIRHTAVQFLRERSAYGAKIAAKVQFIYAFFAPSTL